MAQPKTRIEVLEKFRTALPKKNLFELANQFQVQTTINGELNKGWVGQLLEKIAELDGGNLPQKDGADFELKSTTLVYREEGWHPRETIKITQLNPSKMLDETFETSSLWSKLQKLIIVGCQHLSPTESYAVSVAGIDVTDPELKESIEQFWIEVKNIILEGNIFDFKNYGSSETYVQLRPVGRSSFSSVCPITGEKFPSRAFYATKKLLKRIMPNLAQS